MNQKLWVQFDGDLNHRFCRISGLKVFCPEPRSGAI